MSIDRATLPLPNHCHHIGCSGSTRLFIAFSIWSPCSCDVTNHHSHSSIHLSLGRLEPRLRLVLQGEMRR
jgi:hypothetical protein